MVAAIQGLSRVQPLLELGTGDDHTAEVFALWDDPDDKWTVDNATTGAKWSGIDPYFVDVTCFGHSIETFTGRDRTTETWQVGTATIVLDNRTGWADYPASRPDLVDSFLRVRPGVSVRVSVLVDNVRHILWRGFIDSTTPGYSPEIGETVTLDCIDVKGEAGRGDLAKVALTATVISKAIGSNVATLVTESEHNIVVGDTITVALSPEDSAFDGSYTALTVSATSVSYSRVHADITTTASEGTVTITTQELIHQRLNRILSMQHWPTQWRHFDTSGTPLVATEFGQPVVDALNRAADSGGGAVYGDKDGKIRYRNGGWQLWNAGEPGDGVIGNVQTPVYVDDPFIEAPTGSDLLVPPIGTIETDPPGLLIVPGHLDEEPDGSMLWRRQQLGTPGDVCPTGWELSFARRDFTNRVIIGRADMDQPLVYTDTADLNRYGLEPYTLTDLQTAVMSDITQLADRILRARNFATAPRIAAVTLNAATGLSNVIDLMAAADPRTPTRLLCRHRAQDGRIVFNKWCFVTGIRHTITPESWDARLALDDASPWAIGVEDGVWDTTKWAEAIGDGNWVKQPTRI